MESHFIKHLCSASSLMKLKKRPIQSMQHSRYTTVSHWAALCWTFLKFGCQIVDMDPRPMKHIDDGSFNSR